VLDRPTKLVTRSAEETEQAGARLATNLEPGDIVAVTGDLGAGKTCLIGGIVRGLGGSRPASSPTFVLVNEYRGRLPIFHLDAYRTESLTEVLDLGFDEYLSAGGVMLIEWADKLAPLIPSGAIWIHLDGLGDEPRQITIDVRGSVSPATR
jgi:tRNA threonylcarbamoyladenosine biosynthesis protein TsaE